MVTNSLNPNVVKTFLDGIFYPEYNLNSNPEIAQAEDVHVFMQETSDKAQETLEVFSGVGDWEVRGELQVAAEAQPMSLYSQTFVNQELAKGTTLPGRFFDDDQQSMVSRIVRDFADKGRAAKNKDAFSVYRTGFSQTYGDAVALFSASHPILGGTQSNLGTAKISESSFNDGIIALVEAKELDGVNVGRNPNAALVGTANYKRASIILDSELRPATPNNDMNTYSTKYRIWLRATPYIGTVNGGSDDYWFMVARNHGITRFLRQDVKTKIIDRSVRENDSYYYFGNFRQSVGAASWVGTYGSNGTTGSYDA